MHRPRLYIFIGYPGAGKTTIAKLIHESTGAVHLWADHERQDMFDVVTHSKQESDQLYTKLNQRTEELLAAGKSVVFDTNFNYRKDRDYLREIATRHNADTLVIWMQTPVEVSRERAMHGNHRDRNRYEHVMTAEQFADLICRLEAPGKDENFIIIDGTNIDIPTVKRQLEL